jgi:hypothetical protein
VSAPPVALPAQPSTPRYRRWRAATFDPVAAVLVPTLLVALHALVYGAWIVDDAAITFAYARSVAEGAGPVLQPGAPPVEGYSNPMWLALLVVAKWLGLFDQGTWFGVPDYVAFPKALALAFCATTFGALYVAARALVPRPALLAGIAGCVTAVVPSFVIWSMSGLENSLLAAAVTWIAAVIVTAAARGRLLSTRVAAACGLLAALAALTRPDGAIYVAAFPAAVLLLARQPRRTALIATSVSVTVFAIPVVLYLAWRWSTFHLLLANTAVAKAQGLPDLAALQMPLRLAYYMGGVVALFGAAVVVAALRRQQDRRGLVALLLPLLLAVLAFTVLKQDWMGQHRFATPVWPLAALAITAGTAVTWPTAGLRARRVMTASVAVSTLVAVAMFAVGAAEFRGRPTVPVCSVAQYSGWMINGYASILGLASGTVVTPDVGGAALVGRLRILDLAGLTDSGIARRWAAQDMPGLRDDVFAARPEFIETHHDWSTKTGLVRDPRLADEYAEVRRTSPTDGMWVRRDLVGDPEMLRALQVFDERMRAAGDPYELPAPRVWCGPVLTVEAAPAHT